ncbi:MAG: DUF3500 domain-containing protein [Bacteroidetes bacterium]|nr:DUF3500 domain-containing protein [Bacteroidota bacterium]
MKRIILFIAALFIFIHKGKCQDLITAAGKFINLLDSAQKVRALYPFDVDDRYNFYYFPVDTRKGIPMDQLNEAQKQAAIDLLKTSLSDETVKKVNEIMAHEIILKALESRKPEDHFRDPGKYYLTIFGIPSNKTIWGWRFDGHHVCLNFSAREKKLVAGTPGFLGANPAVVQEGSQKGKEILKDEREMGFALLNAFSPEELKKVIINKTAPGEIITRNDRKAMIDHPEGIRYNEMTSAQQEIFLKLINLYIHRFTKLFADDMLKEIQKAGLENLRFAWAGFTEAGIGKPHYYRIQGPTLLIEYDNTQNNANHVHTVVRDLEHDFGGDALLEHYKSKHLDNIRTAKN